MHKPVEHFLVARGVQEDVAENSHQNSRSQGDEHPDGRNDAGFLDEVAGLYSHETHQYVRHAEVAKSPRQTGKDSRPGNAAVGVLKHVEVVADDLAVGVEELHRRYIRGAEYAYHRYYNQGAEHQQTLYHVGPADSEKSTQERIRNNDDSADSQRQRVVSAEDEVEQLCAAAERGSRVHQEEHENDSRAREADNGVLREEALLEVLGNGDGVACRIGHLAELCREELPVEVGADEKTDSYPAFSQTVQEYRSRKSHQQPAAHIRSLRRDCGGPAAKLPAAYEIIVHALGLLIGHDAYAQHHKRINHKCDNYVYI